MKRKDSSLVKYDRRLRAVQKAKQNENTNMPQLMARRCISILLALTMLFTTLAIGIMVFAEDPANTNSVADDLDPNAPSAGEPIGPTIRMSAPQVAALLGDVTMHVRVNGIDRAETADIAAGVVAENVDAVTVPNLPEKAVYQKAILVAADGSEIEVARVGTLEGKVYYSLFEDDDIGILLKDGEKLVLVYASEYTVTTDQTGEGTITCPDTLSYGEDLAVQITPASNYYVSSVTYEINGVSKTVDAADLRDNSFTIPAAEITNDVQIHVNFERVQAYSVRDACVTESHGGITESRYGDFTRLDAAGITDARTADGVSDAAPLSETLAKYYQKTGNNYLNSNLPDELVPGEEGSFYLYSQSWTGGSKWILNNLRINDEDILIPADTIGSTATTQLSDGSTVTVEYVAEGVGNYWLNGDADYNKRTFKDEYYLNKWSKKRTFYRVTVSDVHNNYDVVYNFKDSSSRELIVKGLNGIEETAASVENLKGLDVYYMYGVDKNPTNAYTTYYNQNKGYKSIELVLYRMKPGYNPYTVTTEMSYDGGTPSSENIRVTGTTADHPEDVIRSAGYPFDTGHRKWGYNTTLANAADAQNGKDLYYNSQPLLLTALRETPGYMEYDWYAVALSEYDSYNQMLYLNATPYQYTAYYDVNGGNYAAAPAGYTEAENPTYGQTQYTNGTIYTLANGNTFTNMPITNPTREGYVFLGWQLIQNGNPVDVNKYYQRNEQFAIDADSIANSEGDEHLDENHTFTFQAQWAPVAATGKTNVRYTAYKEVPEGTDGAVQADNGKWYVAYYNNVDEATLGEVVVLNEHKLDPEDYYVQNTDLSKIKTTSVEMQGNVIPDDNLLYIYYDYRDVSFNVSKRADGDYADLTKAFDIKIKLEPNEESPVPVPAAGTTVTYGNVTFTSDGTALNAAVPLKSGESVSMTDIPYNWVYTVSEDELDGYTTSFENAAGEEVNGTGNLSGEANSIVVVNDKADIPVTAVFDANNKASSVFFIAALVSGAAALFVFAVYKNKKKA